jgi:tetratricopeptide (TPR) repeat protein
MSTAPTSQAVRGGWIRRHGSFAACGVLALGVLFAAYSNHFDNGFYFDDHHVIVENLYIRSLDNIWLFFTDNQTFSNRPENSLYRPLLTLSYALDYWVGGGLDPVVFHRTQFSLLVVLGLLLVLLYRRILESAEPSAAGRYAALFAATLFCVHTANTETVNYLSSRSSLVATLAVVASMLLYVARPRGRRTLVYLLPMLLGGLAKPLTVMFAPLLFAYRILIEERLSPFDLLRGDGWRKAGAALAGTLPAIVAGAGLFLFTSSMDPETVRMSDTPRVNYALTQPYVWLHYARLFVLPVGLTADTDWAPVAGWSDWRIYAGGGFVALLAIVAVSLAATRRMQPAAFGLAWFAIALLPTSSVIPLAEIYNEHRIFFPYVGLALAVGWIAVVATRSLTSGAAARRRRVVTAAAATIALAIVAAHAIGTHTRNRVWADGLSLWKDVTLKSPANGRGLMNYGVALMRHGSIRQALAYFERADRLLPDYDILQINLAIAKSSLRRPGVEAHFLRALDINPRYARGRYYFADWLVDEGRGPQAVRQLERSLAISSGDLEVRSLLERLLAARGDEERLAEVARQTLSIAPSDPLARAYAAGRDPVVADRETPEAYAEIGRREASLGHWLDAAGAFRQALALDPDRASSWSDLGRARLALGFTSEAGRCFDRALAIDPDHEEARALLERARPPRPARGG